MSNIVGYTTVNQKNASLRLNDLELAKRDLINHFHIRKGEKWTQPDFGSNLPYYVFQPLGDSTVQLIKDEVYEIVTYDPRFDLADGDVVLLDDTGRNVASWNATSGNVVVTTDNDGHSITVAVKLIYVPTTTATDLQIKFDREFNEKEEF